MSIRNRVVVAGENMILNQRVTAPTSGTDIKDITVPYTYVTMATGTGGSIYQLNTGTYTLGTNIADAIKNSFNNTYLRQDTAQKDYLRLDGTNFAKETITIGSSTNNTTAHNESVQLYSTEGVGSGIKFGYNNGSFGKDGSLNASNGSMSISSAKIKVNATNQIDINATQKVFVKTKDISVNATNKIVQNSSAIYSDSSYVSIVGKDQLVISSSLGSMYLYATNLSIDASVNYGIKLYDAKLQNPDTAGIDTSVFTFLTADSSQGNTELKWVKVPSIKFISDNSKVKNDFTIDPRTNNFDINDVSVHVRSISFYRNATTFFPEEILYNTEDNISRPVEIRCLYSGAIDSSNNKVYAPLVRKVGADDASTSFIQLCTINDKPIIGDEEFHLVNITDEAYINKTTLSVDTPPENNPQYLLCITDAEAGQINNDHNGTIYKTNVTVSQDQIYAKQYFATSDERLKDNITICTQSKMPTVKEFNWKDTGAKSYGFIAQELEEAGFNELVSTDNNGLKRVDYNAALSLKIATLENENKVLSDKITALEDEVSFLKTYLFTKV